MPRKAAKPKSTCPFTRNEVVGICKRFLKPGAYEPARDVMAFYRLFKLYPDEAFWRAYSLDFQLNAMFYFLSADGRERLSTAISTFHLNLPRAPEVKLEEAKVGEDVVIESKPRTMAELFGS